MGGTHLIVHQDTLEAEIGLAHLTLAPIENILDVNPAPLLALVASFGSPHVRLSIDVGHAHLMGARGAPPAAHWLAQGAGLPGHVHLQDNDGTTDAHLAPGGGTLYWENVLREVRANPHDPRLIVEVTPGELGRAMAWTDGLGEP